MKNKKQRRKRKVYLESEIKCPNCNNFLLEIVQLPSDLCSQEEDNLLVAKRIGYYCPECESRFSDELIIDPD
jgi:Zn finger protein HypA/HybF involved in hydrogenase expression